MPLVRRISFALTLAPALAAVAALATARPAHAGGAAAVTCALAEPDAVEVDGMLDDWQGVAGTRGGGQDKDASFEVRCMQVGDRLALMFDVRDDRLVRLYKAKGKLLDGEDRLEVSLSAGGAPLWLRLFPGAERYEPRVQSGTPGRWKPAPRWVTAESTEQKRGWSFEVVVPLAKLAGWSKATSSIDATIAFHDADEATEKRTQETVEQAVTLGFGDTTKLVDRFLQAVKLRARDITLDEVADVDPTLPGTERVIAGGKIVGLIAERYGYVELPVDKPGDVRQVRLVDLRGDGGRVVLAVVRQYGGGGSRDVLILLGAHDGQLDTLFTVELRKEADGNRLESTWELAAAGSRRTGKNRPKTKRKLRGSDLVITAGDAVGWDEDTFEEVAADDAEPIHLPWDAARVGGVYWLDGDTVRSQPLTAKDVKARRKK
ncbi:MAG: hypothetical protein H6709_00730 [Kofleriaceae bacterium]|nr:hypothetical protein [Kofleriaceae bacterium]MCB9570592.1 hypothetical protein [Kofleriaceae bacterium]